MSAADLWSRIVAAAEVLAGTGLKVQRCLCPPDVILALALESGIEIQACLYEPDDACPYPSAIDFLETPASATRAAIDIMGARRPASDAEVRALGTEKSRRIRLSETLPAGAEGR